MHLFQPRQPKPGGGNNFDPLAPSAPAGREVASQRDGPLLLRVVDDLAQAALKARNDFLAELNSADAQRREINAAAKARLEAELGQMAQTAAKLSDRLFYATRGIINLPVPLAGGAGSQPPTGAEQPTAPDEDAPPQRAPPPAVAPAARPPSAYDADHEVASVNSRPGPTIDALHNEIARLRDEKIQSRVRDRQEFEEMVAAAAEQRAAAEVQVLRSALERASAQKRQALQELETLSREHSDLQHAFNKASCSTIQEDDEGYGMDSVSVIHAGPASTEDGGDAGYANAVKRLEDRVVALSRQLAVEHDARERLEDFLREKGISVDHLGLGTTGVSSELLRTVRKTLVTQLPANASVQDVRAALAQAESRLVEAEEGHSASMMAVDSLMHVINTVSAMDNNSEASVMQALPALASLAAKGAAARALLAAGAAAAVAETMLAHRDNAGLLCEACTVLCVLAGGLLSPLGLSADAAARERSIREAMCDRVASHGGVALIKLGGAHAEDQWVALAVARAIGVVGRGTVAAQRLLDFGAVQLLGRALARYADDRSAYEAAHLSALAMVALAATSAANADTVDRKGGRAALQRAALANTSLARALGMEYPQMAAWLAGRATARKLGGASLFACGGGGDALLPQAESLWLQAVRDAAARRKQPGGSQVSRRSAAPTAASTVSGTTQSSAPRPAAVKPRAPPAAARPPPPPRAYAAPPPPSPLPQAVPRPAARQAPPQAEYDDSQVFGQL